MVLCPIVAFVNWNIKSRYINIEIMNLINSMVNVIKNFGKGYKQYRRQYINT